MTTPTAPPTSVAQATPDSAGSRQALTAIISELCEVEPAQIGADFVLALSGRLRSSLGRATLDAKIRRRLGVKIENLHTVRTFGELEAALAANNSGVIAAAPQLPTASPTGKLQPVPPPSARAPSRDAPGGFGFGLWH